MDRLTKIRRPTYGRRQKLRRNEAILVRRRLPPDHHYSGGEAVTLRLDQIEKSFGAAQAVKGVSFSLSQGQVLSLLGPSGCGKTTTLRMIAGFETPTAGTITLAGQNITHMPARKRNIGMVFQSYALFPHMSVAENVAFGLKMRHISRSERDDRIKTALDIVRMGDFADRSPKRLSGGQQQRIALARALVIKPDILLLDEPLSALDLKLREEMRDEINRIVRELKITTVFVTHDQSEALVLSDFVAVMNSGLVEQLDTPSRLYRYPETPFVADFIGGANVIRGQINADGILALPGGMAIHGLERAHGPIEGIAIRPEDIQLTAPSEASGLSGVITQCRFLGSTTEYVVNLANSLSLDVRSESYATFQVGDSVGLKVKTERIVCLRKK
ncbi:MAG TPA: ABC transporter ATP-binding protein [Dongiaceae bacterium]